MGATKTLRSGPGGRATETLPVAVHYTQRVPPVLACVDIEGCSQAVLLDSVRGTFRYLSPPETAHGLGAPGIWLSRAFVAAAGPAGPRPELLAGAAAPPLPGERGPARAAGFVIARGIPREVAPPGAIVLPAGQAWGDGTHPTTAMALEVLRREAARGAASFLDVGCGAGILLVAAARLGIARRAGVEIDDVARAECAEALEANGAPAALVRALEETAGEAPFDLTVLSIGFAVNSTLLPAVARAASRRLFVGALREGAEEARVAAIARGAGLTPAARFVCRAAAGRPGFGAWVGVLFAAAAAPREMEEEIEIAPPVVAAEAPARASSRLAVLDPPLGTRLLLEMPGGGRRVLELER